MENLDKRCDLSRRVGVSRVTLTKVLGAAGAYVKYLVCERCGVEM